MSKENFEQFYNQNFTKDKIDFFACMEEILDKNICLIEQKDCSKEQLSLYFCFDDLYRKQEKRTLTRGLLYDYEKHPMAGIGQSENYFDVQTHLFPEFIQIILQSFNVVLLSFKILSKKLIQNVVQKQC